MGDPPGNPGHANISEAEEDRDMEELGTHEVDEIVMTKWEACRNTQVFACVSGKKTNAGEDDNATDPDLACAVNQGKGEGGEDVEGDDGGARDGSGEDFEGAGEGVAAEEEGEKDARVGALGFVHGDWGQESASRLFLDIVLPRDFGVRDLKNEHRGCSR